MPLPSIHINDLNSLSIDLQQFIDEMPMGVMILDRNRRVVLVNRTVQAMTGISQEEAKGITCAYILKSKKCIVACPFLNNNDLTESITEESNIVNRDRQLVPVRMTFTKVKNLEDHTVGYVEFVEDLRPLKTLRAEIDREYNFSGLIGKSEQMLKINKVLPVIAQSDSSVLITGETGTGKDLIAEAIHQASDRSKGPFIKVNCGALPETLLESELFGHVKGAFTGAVENKPGRFRLAHSGTLFLTEIGDLPMPLQVKLLTFLDDKVVHPLGSTKGFQADVRIIAGTHRNLGQMVRDGKFRDDLLFRLNVVRLHLPPLRERGDDILLLMDTFRHTFNSRFSKDINGFSKNAIHLLKKYSYPGNVRELRNIVEYAVNICTVNQIETAHLPSYITEPHHEEGDVEFVRDENEDRAPLSADKKNIQQEDYTWAAMEKKMILEAMMKSGGRKNAAAKILGWGRSTLWRKMKQYNID